MFHSWKFPISRFYVSATRHFSFFLGKMSSWRLQFGKMSSSAYIKTWNWKFSRVKHVRFNLPRINLPRKKRMPKKAVVKSATATINSTSSEREECVRWFKTLSSSKCEALIGAESLGNFSFDFQSFINGNCISIDARSLHEKNVAKLVDSMRQEGFIKNV